MKLTKETEAELLKAYYHFWDANLSADMERFGSYLVDDFSAIGSANGEVFFSKHDAVKFYTATADEMRGKAELRNRSVSVQPLDINSVIVREESDLYVLIGEEWAFYGHARISCIVKHVDGSWKAVHQHASFPDHRTEEGQQLAAEKIEKENLELREAVKRRTAELEHKTRDLEIESCLERVRAVAMGMRKPDDMLDVCRTIARQLELLKVKEIRNVQTAIIYESKGTYLNYEYYVKHDKLLTTEVNYNLHPEHATFVNKMLESPEAFYTQGFTGKELKDWYSYQKTTPQFADSYLEHATSLNYYMYSIGGVVLGMSTYAPLSEEEINLFKRFRNVFDLAYRRFVDIEKAEAQAREAQIEAGLERVRSRSLAMHKTSELQEVIHTVHKELLTLNIAIAGGSFIAINSEVDTELRCWGSGGTADTSAEVHLPRYDKTFLSNLIKGIKSGAGFFTEEYTQPEKKEFFTFLFKHEPWSTLDSKQKNETLESPGGYTRSCCVSQYTSIFIINHFGEKFSEADNDILKRFGKVFEQAYTRFLDLQKAEAQTRAAQIELAVERVRAKALAMHNSAEILEVVETLRTEMLGLEIPGVVAATIYLQEEDGYIRMWDLSSVIEMEDGFHVALDVKFKLEETDPGLYIRRVWKNSENYFVEKQEEKDMAITIEWLRQYYPEQAADVQQFMNATPWKYLLHPTIQLAQGKMSVDILDTQPPAEMESTMLKMGAAFDLAYKRFLDLQKSEKQIREAQIELALERVRARTMAMQHSDELAEVSLVLDTQVRTLGIKTQGCAFNIYNETDSTEWFSSEMGAMPPYKTPRENLFLRYYEAGEKGESIHIEEFAGEACIKHYEYLSTVPGMGDGIREMLKAGGSLPERQIDHAVYFKYGYLLFITLEPVPEAHETFIRFVKVFEQTYTRFLDLQKAEAQAREAQIEAALERVRSKAMAMHTSEDLLTTVDTFFSELSALNVTPRRCGMGIINKESRIVDIHVTTRTHENETKKMMGNLTLKGHPVLDLIFENWIQQKEYHPVLRGSEIKNYYKAMNPEVVFPDFATDAVQYGYYFFFKEGGVFAWTDKELEEIDLEIFRKYTSVLSLTYRRYIDLKEAEAQALRAEQDIIEIKSARKKAEDALIELQLTQKQLIQSEKMASLGELTAGIAHEIQNPLNFVNNFSDVSTELIDEMNVEIEKGNNEEAKQIAQDLKQNLEKINHHGKRAGDIVKGMLQHSRTNSGQKELTDINLLCDEYLRLAYHGLKAKDKTFNAKFETNLDESLQKINVVPQDIGRVVLNLINNAFYAVSERLRQAQPDSNYEPTVTVTTKKADNKVLISVKDNGSGIPLKVLDKIFQPFFTTKPTGQGTGLGLSLSYDIVKTHGGELKVETNEGIGTEFSILLPIGIN